MGNKNSSPPPNPVAQLFNAVFQPFFAPFYAPPPPPRPLGPNYTNQINAGSANLSNKKNSLYNLRKYILEYSGGTIASCVKQYDNYVSNLIPNRIKNYTNETNSLLTERNKQYNILMNLINQYNANIKTLQQKKGVNLEHINRLVFNSLENNILNNNITTDTSQYYDNIHTQNYLLNNNRKDVNEKYSIDDSLINYVSDSIDSLKFINNIMFIIYYFLITVLALFMYDKNIPLFSKITLFIILILFPFYVTELQDNLMLMYNYLFIKS